MILGNQPKYFKCPKYCRSFLLLVFTLPPYKNLIYFTSCRKTYCTQNVLKMQRPMIKSNLPIPDVASPSPSWRGHAVFVQEQRSKSQRIKIHRFSTDF